jgi:hypothetical protein
VPRALQKAKESELCINFALGDQPMGGDCILLYGAFRSTLTRLFGTLLRLDVCKLLNLSAELNVKSAGHNITFGLL